MGMERFGAWLGIENSLKRHRLRSTRSLPAVDTASSSHSTDERIHR